MECLSSSPLSNQVVLRNYQNLDAGDRFELPMHLAYETGVVATLPATKLHTRTFHYGGVLALSNL